MVKCKFSNCHDAATKTWALVPLCEDHYELIADETARHYKGEGGAAEAASRPCYMKIAHLIPWSKLLLGKLPGVTKSNRGRKRTHGTCVHCNKKFRLEFLAEHEGHCKGARKI